MDYYGLLFLYYLKGLSGKSVLRLFFNIEAGGTEQLLPENTSTPTTTPILADIQYPDGLRTDQYFTYRETPTTVSNKARIKTIKGNTLVWNQLVQNGNFAENVAWNGFGGTYSYADNVGILTVTSASSSQGISAVRTRVQASANHILLLKLDIKSDNANALFGVSLNTNSLNTNNVFSSKHASTSWETWSAIITPTVNVEGMRIATYTDGLLNVGEKLYVRNVNLIDLTAMFGSGNEPTTVEEFTSFFPLSYYSYNQGSLLSFNGNGIKTVGKNQIDQSTFVQGSVSGTGVDTSTTTRLRSALTKVLPNTQYTLSGVNSGTRIYEVHYYDGSGVWITFQSINREQATFTTLSNAEYIKVLIRHTDNSTIEVAELTALQLEIGSTATSFESYAESILSLPISTYFPNGMKSARNVYDELTPSKAITRIGAADLGTITYTYDGECFIGKLPSDAKVLSDNAETLNSVSDRYLINNWSSVKYLKSNMTLGTGVNRYICIFNNSYTDATAFKTAMSGVYLYYELATPIETPITTEDANEALSLLMGKSVSSNNANQMINIITKGE